MNPSTTPHLTRRSLLQRAAASAAAFTTVAIGQQRSSSTYPNRPVHLIVPVPPGGGNDLIARDLGNRLQAHWGQPVLVENRAGAGGNLGADVVAKSPADGHTLLMAANQLVMNPALYATMPFNVARDFAPVALIGTAPILLVVHPSLPIQTVHDLIAYAQQNPGKLSYASAGIGQPQHLAAEVFKSMTRTDILHVPFKGAGQLLPDLLAGRVQLFFGASSALLPHVKSGALRALAVGDRQRHPLLPTIPTLDESGVPGYQVDIWYGILAPSATPAALLDRLQRDIETVAKAADFRDKLAGAGIAVQVQGRQQFRTRIASDLARWDRVIKAAGIKAE